MSYTTLPYTKKNKKPRKTVYYPLLNTKLFYKDAQTLFDFLSVIDSGAAFCVFPANYGAIIGLDIKKGRPIVSYGVGGSEILYFHLIKVGIYIRNEIWKFNADVGFSYKMNMKGTGLLGGKDFLINLLKLFLIKIKKCFELKNNHRGLL